MNQQVTESCTQTLELPVSAPQVRLTAGMGSVGQKTWNVRRPVTIIGSRRQCHIVLHGPDISKAHCAIVNTGTHILLKDLGSTGGTWRGDKRTDLTVLSDGDVIRVGETAIQIAIQTAGNSSDDSDCGVEFVDPMRFEKSIVLREPGTSNERRVSRAVTLIGRAVGAEILIDESEVSLAHAIIFRFGKGPAICDLGSRTGTRVNGEMRSLSLLRDGARVQIGQKPYIVHVPDALNVNNVLPPGGSASDRPGNGSSAACQQSGVWPNPMRHVASSSADDAPTSAVAAALAPKRDVGEDTVRAFANIETGIAALEESLADTWDQLNQSPPGDVEPADAAAQRTRDLDARQSELESRDAELRGLLHDLTQEYAQVVQREKAVQALRECAQAEREELDACRVAIEAKQVELLQRETEVERREKAIAQRWGRLSAAKCQNADPNEGPSQQPR